MSDRTAYFRDYKRRLRESDPNYLMRARESMRRHRERKAIAMAAELTASEQWELLHGFKAAERGQPYDKHQHKDWRRGWKIWNRRHGQAA